MPFIKGESLKTAIEKDGRMSVPEVVRVMYHVGEALDYAHEAGIVHRDIKPANILRSGSYALITDFGVAKALNAAMPSGQAMTSTGMAIGTPAYMAPEQLAGDSAADHRVDIYALGLLAYELLHGKSPFAASTPRRMLAAVLTQDPTPLIEVEPDVPQELSDVVMRCLAKEPEKRFSNARELLTSLDLFSNESGVIRTMESRVAHIVHTPTPTSGITPVVVRDHPTSTPESTPTVEVEPEPAEPVAAGPSLSAEVYYGGYSSPPPKKSRTGLFAGIVGVLALITLGGFLWSQRGVDGSPVAGVAATDSTVGLVADSNSVQSPLPGGAKSTVVAVLPAVDSQAIRDSIRLARAEAAKKAAARRDSLKKAQETRQVQTTPVQRARNAVNAMFADRDASRAFARGATRKGGVLGTRTRGDLQTQIDALQPFLRQAGISYEHFKLIVENAGVSLFDDQGRMIPAALEQFATGS